MACGILIPRPGMEPALHAVEVQSLSPWTAREFPVDLSSLHPRACIFVSLQLSLGLAYSFTHCEKPSLEH